MSEKVVDRTPPKLFTKAAQGLLAVILAVYFVLTIIYSLVTPPLESPDAYFHYGVIEYFSREFTLPSRENPQDQPWTHAVYHAPLYYMMSGLLIAPLDTSDFPEEYPKNPHARIGLPHSLNNHNYVSIKGEPWRQTYLAVYIVRAFSMMWGAITLVSIFTLARIFKPDDLWMAGVAGFFVAFTPQFLYMSAVINNDNMVVACGMLTLTMLIYMIKYTYSWRLIIIMSVVMAMGALSKVNALPLYPAVALGLSWVAYRDRVGWQKWFMWGVTVFGIWAILDGWWYIYNIIESGDVTATVPLAIAAGGASGVPTGADALWGEFIGVYYSFWGLFGWFNIIAPQSFYNFITVLLAIALVGSLYGAFRREWNKDDWMIIGVLVAHSLMVFLGWWRFRGLVSAAQGRMLFSIFAAIACFVAYGLTVYRPKLTRIVPIVLIAGLAVAGVGFPFMLLQPAYAKPAQLDTIPDTVNQVDVRYGPVVLRGYTINPEPVHWWEYQVPDDREFIEITLYWQPLERTEEPLSMFVQIFATDENFEPIEVGKVDSYPGRGMMRTDNWETDIIYADRYYLELYGEFDLAPFEPRFRVGLRNNETDVYIPATTRDGDPIDAVVPRGGTVYTTETTCEPLANPANVSYEGLMTLTGYDLAETTVAPSEVLELNLTWQTDSETPDDYRVFVQLIDANDPSTLIGSGDSVPKQDWYPSTRFVEGVCFNDTYFVEINPDAPAGDYNLLVGIYNPETGTRLNGQSSDTAQLLGGGYLIPRTVTLTAPPTAHHQTSTSD